MPQETTCYHCPYCKTVFPNQDALYQHQLSYHQHPRHPTNWFLIPNASAQVPTHSRAMASRSHTTFSQPLYPQAVLPKMLPTFQYIVLSSSERDLVFQKLSALCHQETRLLTRKFVMSTKKIVPIRNPKEKQIFNSNELTTPPYKENDPPKRAPPGPKSDPQSKNKTKSTQPGKDAHLPPELFLATPQRTLSERRREAVAIDCEMVGTINRHSELIYLSAVDFLTGEILIDSYVQPTERVTCWRSSVSGVTREKMRHARGMALPGWQAARRELWRFIDDQTVLIGHALENDLQVLGIIHHRIVDSAILTAEAVFPIEPDKQLPRVWALKTLAKELRGQDIQMSKLPHSALQDAYAARDIVVFCIQSPDALKDWADAARKIEEEKTRELECKRRQAREEALKKREETMKKEGGNARRSDGRRSDGS